MESNRVIPDVAKFMKEEFFIDKSYLSAGSLISRLHDTVTRHSQKKAIIELHSHVVDGEVQYIENFITYSQLNQRSNQIANMIRAKHIPQTSVISIALSSKLDLCISIWGVIKSGHVFHVARMFNDPVGEKEDTPLGGCVPTVLLTENSDLSSLRYDQHLTYPDHPVNDQSVETDDEQYLYVVSTSGSVTRPKHIAIRHHSVLNLVHWRIQHYRMGADTHTLSLVNCQFDAFLADFFSNLLCGGSLMLIHPADERNFIAIAKIMETTEFTNITGTPSVYARVLQFVRNPFPKVRYLISGGESLTMPLFTKIKACFPEAILYNEYGPAECCIVATCGIITGKNTLNNIGEPINNTALFIDGEQMKGELYITGVGTSGRYLDETMNTGTFFPNPWQPHMQVYRTGDVVNRQKNRFVYVNRLDDIVKINGLMVDKKEVKQALLEHENILDAKVTVENDENGQTFLAAYVQLQTNPLDEPALRKELQQKLLYYMIPTKLISVLSLPLDEHGKTIVPKQTALQTSREIIAEKVLQCWKTVLQQDTLKTDQSFFEQGGNSLLFIDLFLLLNEEYEGMITVPELMEFYTIQNQINFLYNKLNEKEKETL